MFSRRLSIGLFTALLAVPLAAPAFAKDKGRVLVYSGSTGYRHESIPAAVASMQALAEKAGYVIDTSEDPEVFTAEISPSTRLLVLVSNSTDPKKPESEWFTERSATRCRNFLKSGKGVIGLHAASDSHYGWGWYGQMIGGYFERHPKGTPKGVVTVVDAKHPATAKTTQVARAQRRVVLLQGFRSDRARAGHHRPEVHR
jgi:type 1 glutamine amidotransferase